MNRPINTILALVIIAVIAAAIGGYVWWQTSQEPAVQTQNTRPTTKEQQEMQLANNQQQEQVDPYAGWKTLQGSFGYTIKYPEGFFTKLEMCKGGYDGKTEGYDIVVNAPIKVSCAQDTIGPVEVDIYRIVNTEEKSIDQIYQEQQNNVNNLKQNFPNDYGETTVLKVNLSNVQGVRSIFVSKGSGGMGRYDIHTYIIKNNYIYILRGDSFSAASGSETLKGYKDALIKIEDTFKFTK